MARILSMPNTNLESWSQKQISRPTEVKATYRHWSTNVGSL